MDDNEKHTSGKVIDKRILVIIIAAVAAIALILIAWQGLGLFDKTPKPSDIGDAGQAASVDGESEGVVKDAPKEEAALPPSEEEQAPKPSDVLEGEWSAAYEMADHAYGMGILFEEDLSCSITNSYYATDATLHYWGTYYFDQSRGLLTLDIYLGEWIKWGEGEGGSSDGRYEDTGRENSTEQIKCEFLVRQANVGSMLFTALNDTNLVPIDTSFVMMYYCTSHRLHIFEYGQTLVYYYPVINPDNYILWSDRPGEHTSVMPDEFLPAFEQLRSTSELNVRLGPGKNYLSLGAISKGTVMDKIGSVSGSDDWIFVLLDSGGGWVKAEYTEPAADKLTLYEAGIIAQAYVDSKNEHDDAEFTYNFTATRKIQGESVYVISVSEYDEYTERNDVKYGRFGVGIESGNLYDMASGKRLN